jgi:Putative adhesin
MTTHRYTSRLSILASSVALALIVPSIGCVGVMGLGGCDLNYRTYDATRSASVQAAEAMPLRVKTRNGSVKVLRSTGSEATVIATIRASSPERLEAFIIDVSKETDGTIVVRPTPPDGDWKHQEGVSLEIRIPGTTRVEIDAGNGAIHIVGLAGQAELTTSNGAIHVEDHDGDVKATTSNGRIEAKDLNGQIQARTRNGAIDVGLADDATEPVELRTSNGAISLGVPPSFAGVVKAETSNGSIRIDAPEASVKKGRSSATITMPSPGATSTLETSNGRITLRVRR